MASDGEVYAASPVEIMADVPKKIKGKKNTKKAGKAPANPAPSDVAPLPPTEVSDKEHEEMPSDVSPGMEWIMKETANESPRAWAIACSRLKTSTKTWRKLPLRRLRTAARTSTTCG